VIIWLHLTILLTLVAELVLAALAKCRGSLSFYSPWLIELNDAGNAEVNPYCGTQDHGFYREGADVSQLYSWSCYLKGYLFSAVMTFFDLCKTCGGTLVKSEQT
jgi:uncharacterized protein (DUF983 family)